MSTWRTSKEGTAAGVTVTVVEPTGITQGDFEFVVMDMPSSVATVATPDGWTLLTHTPAGGGTSVYVFYVTGGRGASAPGLAFTATAAGAEWHCLGVSLGAPWTIDQFVSGTLLTGSTTQPNPPAAIASGSADEAIAIGMNFDGLGGSTFTPPTGYTARSIQSAGLDVGVASKTLSAPGSEDPAAFAGWQTTPATDVWAGTILLMGPSGVIPVFTRPFPFAPGSPNRR